MTAAIASATLGLPSTVLPVPLKFEAIPDWSLDIANQSFCFYEVKRRYKGAAIPGPIRVHKFRTDVPILIFGIDPAAAHIPVIHPSVSRQHAVVGFHKATAKCVLVDLQSENGTYCNDVPVDPDVITELYPGFRLRFGNIPHEFIFGRVEEKVPAGDGPAASADAHTEASGPSASRNLAALHANEVNSGLVGKMGVNMNSTRAPPLRTDIPISVVGGAGGTPDHIMPPMPSPIHPRPPPQRPSPLQQDFNPNITPDRERDMERRRSMDMSERRHSLEGRSERPTSPPPQERGFDPRNRDRDRDRMFVSDQGEQYNLNRPGPDRDHPPRGPPPMRHNGPPQGHGPRPMSPRRQQFIEERDRRDHPPPNRYPPHHEGPDHGPPPRRMHDDEPPNRRFMNLDRDMHMRGPESRGGRPPSPGRHGPPASFDNHDRRPHFDGPRQRGSSPHQGRRGPPESFHSGGDHRGPHPPFHERDNRRFTDDEGRREGGGRGGFDGPPFSDNRGRHPGGGRGGGFRHHEGGGRGRGGPPNDRHHEGGGRGRGRPFNGGGGRGFEGRQFNDERGRMDGGGRGFPPDGQQDWQENSRDVRRNSREFGSRERSW